jgi:hypothetical protein
MIDLNRVQLVIVMINSTNVRTLSTITITEAHIPPSGESHQLSCISKRHRNEQNHQFIRIPQTPHYLHINNCFCK